MLELSSDRFPEMGYMVRRSEKISQSKSKQLLAEQTITGYLAEDSNEQFGPSQHAQKLLDDDLDEISDADSNETADDDCCTV